MSNINPAYPNLRFPKKEYAVAFIAEDSVPFNNALIGITYPDPEYRINRSASAPITVFEYVLEGKGEIMLDGKWHTVSAGQIYILRNGEEHRYRSNAKNPYKKIWVNYVAPYLSALLDSYAIKSGIYESENAKAYFDQLLELTKSPTVSKNTHFSIAECVHKIIHTVATERLAEKTDEYRIREALNASVYDKLSLEDLAAKLHISKSNVIRVFKKSYGVTPYEYLLTLKIATAKLLLRDTKMTVKEISDRLHISDEHYFSSLFLARVGMRPKDYRNKKR
jgi:AraC-like DNA-binding protein